MKYGWVIGVVVLTATCAAQGQITRVATFENFNAGHNFPVSFTDPLSGITFRDSTHPPAGGFTINVDSAGVYFNDGNYLTAGGGVSNTLAFFFGFMADLPSAADRVVVQALYVAQPRSDVLLEGFNSSGGLVAQQQGPPGPSNSPFSLQINSSQFDIVMFRVSVGGGAAGYDNISYTILPEPGFLPSVLVLGLLLPRRRSLRFRYGQRSAPRKDGCHVPLGNTPAGLACSNVIACT